MQWAFHNWNKLKDLADKIGVSKITNVKIIKVSKEDKKAPTETVEVTI